MKMLRHRLTALWKLGKNANEENDLAAQKGIAETIVKLIEQSENERIKENSTRVA